ncbi:hypothetical protein [Microbacterium sp. NPDC058389]|uniref:hypothetical protein n=1 Tax=Microbacterium sp. NPDC058389 TaxID=3346475 RepID=UPI00365619BB
MSLRGLPDFDAPVLLDGAPAGYRGFGEPGLVLVPPRTIGIARSAEGHYAFEVGRFRGRGDWPEPYAVLTMTLRAEHPLDDVLRVARVDDPAARVAPTSLAAGTIRLAGFFRVRDLDWDGLAPLTWSDRLTVEEYAVLRGAIEAAFPETTAAAVLEITGVAARANARATVDPAALSAALLALGAPGESVSRADVVAWLRTQGMSGDRRVVEVTGDVPDEARLADLLADRIRARWPGHRPPAPEAPGTWQWDLAEPVVTARELAPAFPLFETYSAIAADIDSYVPAGVELDPVPAGWRTIDVLANLPTRQSGVVACGVDITAPPRPPARPQAITTTVELTGTGTGRTTLRLAPGEEPDLVHETWAVVADADGARELRGRRVPFNGERLSLRPTDFPVRAWSIDVEPALLDLAAVRVRVTSPGPGAGPHSFDIDEPHADVAMPAGDDAAVTVELTSRTDGRVLVLGPFASAPLWIGRHLLPGWGPHRIAVSSPGADALVAVALRGESDDTGDGETVALTPAAPVRTWRWFADDPFRDGYRFRVAPTGAAPGPWSDVRPHDEDLVVAPAGAPR